MSRKMGRLDERRDDRARERGKRRERKKGCKLVSAPSEPIAQPPERLQKMDSTRMSRAGLFVAY